MIFGRAPKDLKSRSTGRSSLVEFTPECRDVLAMARDESARLDHSFVNTEHLLLAATKRSASTVRGLLARLGHDVDELRARVEQEATREQDSERRKTAGEYDRPYTARAKKVLEHALSEARDLDARMVGPEHLLLGMVLERSGIAGEQLRERGVTAQRLRVILQEEAREEPPVPLRVVIDDTSEHSIYEQIIHQVQEAVATGQLSPGMRLPAVRQLADELDVAPGTVARAYAELERRQVVVTDGARGTRVAQRASSGISPSKRPELLVELLRPAAVAAFHLGASAAELRDALKAAMRDIFDARP